MFNVCHSKSLSPRPWSRKAGITNTVIQLIFAGSIIITWLYIKTISVSQKRLARKSASICIRQVGRWVGVAKLGSCWLRMIKVSEETLLPSKEAFVKMCLCEVRNVQLLRKKYLFAITITIKLSECQTVRRLSFHESRGPFSTKCFTQVTLLRQIPSLLWEDFPSIREAFITMRFSMGAVSEKLLLHNHTSRFTVFHQFLSHGWPTHIVVL